MRSVVPMVSIGGLFLDQPGQGIPDHGHHTVAPHLQTVVTRMQVADVKADRSHLHVAKAPHRCRMWTLLAMEAEVKVGVMAGVMSNVRIGCIR